MIDGKIVAETPEQAFLAGHAMKIPVIAGANSSDIGFSFAKSMDELLAPFGANKEKAQVLTIRRNRANFGRSACWWRRTG
jgi:para-nitrobenzyl esterase